MRLMSCIGYLLILRITSVDMLPQPAPQDADQPFLATLQAASPKTAEKLATCSISGLVVRIGTNEPIRKARVDLYRMDEHRNGYREFTDAAGRFLVEDIEPGRYQLQVSRVGYMTQSYGQDSSSGSGMVLTLVPGRKIADLLFRMTPWGVISGRITDEDGQPMAAVEVVTLQSQMHKGKRKLFSSQSAQTNDLGEYRLYGLSKGHYYLRVEHSERQTPDHPIMVRRIGYAPVYYPGSVNVSRAVAVDVSPGQEVPSVDFKLIPTRAVRIRGSVFNAILGKPGTSCCVFLEPRDTDVVLNVFHPTGQTLGPNGTFEIDNVVPGSFTLVASAFVEGKVHYARLPVEVGDTDLEEIKLTILPGVDLVGRVAIEGREPVDPSVIHVHLEDSDSDLSSIRPADVKPDGTFKFADVSLGSYEVGVSGGPWGAYLKSARINGEDILNGKLDVSPGKSRSPIEIILSSDGCQVDGAVTDEDGLPIAGASVVLIPDGDRRKQYRLYKDVKTDQYGKFLLRGIAPGDYKLFAWKGMEADEWQDPDFLRPFEGKGVAVKAEENGHSSVALKLILGGEPNERPQSTP